MAVSRVSIAAAEIVSGRRWSIPSRSGGAGHEVAVKTAADGSRYLTCTCPGGRFAWATAAPSAGRGCWAMQAVRAEIRIG